MLKLTRTERLDIQALFRNLLNFDIGYQNDGSKALFLTNLETWVETFVDQKESMESSVPQGYRYSCIQFAQELKEDFHRYSFKAFTQDGMLNNILQQLSEFLSTPPEKPAGLGVRFRNFFADVASPPLCERITFVEELAWIRGQLQAGFIPFYQPDFMLELRDGDTQISLKVADLLDIFKRQGDWSLLVPSFASAIKHCITVFLLHSEESIREIQVLPANLAPYYLRGADAILVREKLNKLFVALAQDMAEEKACLAEFSRTTTLCSTWIEQAVKGDASENNFLKALNSIDASIEQAMRAIVLLMTDPLQKKIKYLNDRVPVLDCRVPLTDIIILESLVRFSQISVFYGDTLDYKKREGRLEQLADFIRNVLIRLGEQRLSEELFAVVLKIYVNYNVLKPSKFVQGLTEDQQSHVSNDKKFIESFERLWPSVSAFIEALTSTDQECLQVMDSLSQVESYKETNIQTQLIITSKVQSMFLFSLVHSADGGGRYKKNTLHENFEYLFKNDFLAFVMTKGVIAPPIFVYTVRLMQRFILGDTKLGLESRHPDEKESLYQKQARFFAEYLTIFDQALKVSSSSSLFKLRDTVGSGFFDSNGTSSPVAAFTEALDDDFAAAVPLRLSEKNPFGP